MKYTVSDRFYIDEIEVEIVLKEFWDEQEAMKICKVGECSLYEDRLSVRHPILGDIEIRNDEVKKYSFYERKVPLEKVNFLNPNPKDKESLCWDIETAYEFLRQRYPYRNRFELSFICHVINGE